MRKVFKNLGVATKVPEIVEEEESPSSWRSVLMSGIAALCHNKITFGRTLSAFLGGLAFFGSPGYAEEAPARQAEIRIFPARDKADIAVNQLKLQARGGETIDLKADLFAMEGEDGKGALRPRNSTVNEFRWTVTCNVRARQQGCVNGEVVPEGEALRYKLPNQMQGATVEIEVTHISETAQAGLVDIRVPGEHERGREGAEPDAGSDKNKKIRASEAAKELSVRPHPSKERADDANDKPNKKGGRGGSNSSGASLRSSSDDSSSGGGGSSGSKKSSLGKKSGVSKDWSSDRGYDDFGYSGFSGSGGGSQVNTRARGYNRSNSTPVVSCVHQGGTNGHSRLVCEDSSKKVLRVRREFPQAKVASAKLAARVGNVSTLSVHKPGERPIRAHLERSPGKPAVAPLKKHAGKRAPLSPTDQP